MPEFTSQAAPQAATVERTRAATLHDVHVRSHRRVVRVSYLVSRLEPYSHLAYRAADTLTRTAGLGSRKVGVNLGDIFTIVARKPVA